MPELPHTRECHPNAALNVLHLVSICGEKRSKIFKDENIFEGLASTFDVLQVMLCVLQVQLPHFLFCAGACKSLVGWPLPA